MKHVARSFICSKCWNKYQEVLSWCAASSMRCYKYKSIFINIRLMSLMFFICREKKNSPGDCCPSFAPDVLRSVNLSVRHLRIPSYNILFIVLSYFWWILISFWTDSGAWSGSSSFAEVSASSHNGVRLVYLNHNHVTPCLSWHWNIT